MKKMHFIVLAIILLGFTYSLQAQNTLFRNLELKFVDSTTCKPAFIYVFKETEHGVYFDNDRGVYFYGPMIPVKSGYKSDKMTELKLNDKYDLTAIKFEKPVILKTATPYKLFDSVTYLPRGNGEELFWEHDTVRVDLYFSPNLFMKYYIRPTDTK